MENFGKLLLITNREEGVQNADRIVGLVKLEYLKRNLRVELTRNGIIDILMAHILV